MNSSKLSAGSVANAFAALASAAMGTPDSFKICAGEWGGLYFGILFRCAHYFFLYGCSEDMAAPDISNFINMTTEKTGPVETARFYKLYKIIFRSSFQYN